jgi:hypothetical protein
MRRILTSLSLFFPFFWNVQRIDLPYAPDTRFMKARFEEDKHSLTVVFPREKTADIELL